MLDTIAWDLQAGGALCRALVYAVASLYAWRCGSRIGAVTGGGAATLVVLRELHAPALLVELAAYAVAVSFSLLIVDHAGYRRRRRVLEAEARTPQP